MINIDSPNIFWSRIKDYPKSENYKLMIFHNDPQHIKRVTEDSFTFRYEPNKRRINKWFYDKSDKFNLHGWWND